MSCWPMSIPNPRTDLMTLAVIDKSHGWNWMMFLQVKLDNQVIIPTRFEHVHEVMKIIFRCYNNHTSNQHLAIISQESLCTWCTTKSPQKTKMIIAVPARRWENRGIAASGKTCLLTLTMPVTQIDLSSHVWSHMVILSCSRNKSYSNLL